MADTVMLIDDDPAVHQLVKATLRPTSCQVESAYGGREALASLARVKPDVLIVDLTMPQVDGWQVIDHVRKDERWKNVPIIVMTARTGYLDRAFMARLMHIDAYVTKPFEPKHLRTIVRGALRKARTGTTE